MERIKTKPREGWQKLLENDGFVFHTNEDGTRYWDESAYYSFTESEILELEKAANELQEMCVEAGQYIIDNDLFDKLQIPPFAAKLIKQAWKEEPPSIYGRFDFAYDGENPPKLLEYNADTPTSLIEGSVAQWKWLQDKFPKEDQFNSLHERLIAKWKDIKPAMKGGILHFACMEETVEDESTVAYLADTAQQAGISPKFILMSDLGWDEDNKSFLDMEGNRITDIFKLYPWEWMVAEKFGQNIIECCDNMNWIEPIWKMMWSNKAILPVLWQMYPDHKYLLPSYFNMINDMRNYVKKPIFSREGANITIYCEDGRMSYGKDRAYGKEGYIYQELAELPNFDGNYPVLGCWIIDGEAAGMGIRESRDQITTNESRFVPHLFKK